MESFKVVAICDDNSAIHKQLENYLFQYYQKNDIQLFHFLSGEALLKSTKHFDLIFMDIELENMNGIETSIEIRKTDIDVYIVMISAYEDYKKYGYSLHLFDYLDKPIKYERFIKLIEEWEKYRSREKEKQHVTFKGVHGNLRFNIDDIYYFEYTNRKIKVITTHGDFEFYGKLKEIARKMDAYGFVSSHQAYLFNLAYVLNITPQEVWLVNNYILPLSRKKLKEVNERYNQYLGHMIER